MEVIMDFLLKKGCSYSVLLDDAETDAVKIAAANLSADLVKVLGAPDTDPPDGNVPKIVVGTLGRSAMLTDVSASACLYDGNGVLRKEAFMICVRNGDLLIAGTDRRGTVYGIYDFCEQIGVSPWYFWADVPVKTKREIRIRSDYFKIDYPSVEYRGIFINDEEELEAWAIRYLGESTIGVKTYEKIFELILRLKGNYIWPAMHVNSFNALRENGALAERMGIVVGTSHCDMLMRSNNREWMPWLAKKGYSGAKYDYSIPGKNREILREYWRESVQQNKNFEVCYTLGMRGIHDSGFETGNLSGKSAAEMKQAKAKLLTTIIRDQMDILHQSLDAEPMMTFIPYKEVMELYDSGMEIPEELTLVWANDNYGYIRRYPSEKEKMRKGGNGIYYHNSYWAPPSMSYVFLCSIPLAHTRNELRKAYEEGIRKLWVLNVGALKPLEQEITFWLRLAWEIGKDNALTNDVDAWVADWIDRTFSGGIGKDTAALLNDFSQLTNVRKLENMDYDAFSQTSYGDEAAVRIHAYESLFQKGNALYSRLPESEKDAFFQLVLMRVHAAYFTNLQYYYGDRSTLMHRRGLMQAAAFYVNKALALDDARRKMLVYYNKTVSSGKWDGILNPEGFPPPRAAMMPVCTPPLEISGKPRMIVSVWNDADCLSFVQPAEKWIEIGSSGKGEFSFRIDAPDWVRLSRTSGVVKTEERVLVRVTDTSESRAGKLVIHDLTGGVCTIVPVRITHLDTSCPNLEDDGKVAVSAASVDVKGSGFRRIKRLGRGAGDLVEAFGTGPLSYRVFFTSKGQFLLEVHRFPSLNSNGRIRIGVSVDGGPVQVLESEANDEWRGGWRKNVLNNVDRLYLRMPVVDTGEHTVTFHPMDRYFAFSRFVIYTEERKDNNFIGIDGNQSLPVLWDIREWTDAFYGKITLRPRPVEFARPEMETNNLAASGLIKCDRHYAQAVEPKWYLNQGNSPFDEQDGTIRIDAASALAQSRYAFTCGYVWQYCSSESYVRSGLAMYIRKPEMKWTPENAPALRYLIRCGGGKYTIWLLAKFNTREESYFAVGVDEQPLPPDQIYMKGSLWRYEAEQIYRWVPAAQVCLAEGSHMLLIYALASGLRFDRIFLTKYDGLPPMDSAWMRRE